MGLKTNTLPDQRQDDPESNLTVSFSNQHMANEMGCSPMVHLMLSHSTVGAVLPRTATSHHWGLPPPPVALLTPKLATNSIRLSAGTLFSLAHLELKQDHTHTELNQI